VRLNDTSVVITGGASGLGGATAELLASHGAKVTVFDLNTEAGEAIAARIGGRFEKVDVTDESSVAAGLDRATEAHGTPRILVNCAGIVLAMKTVGREGQPHALDRFRKVVEVNLIGAYNVISKFAARLSTAEMLDDERGVIINTASVAAYEGQVGQAAYAASKAGVVGMTITVARDLAQFGIRVCTIAPGIFWTPMLGSLSQTVQDSLGQQVPFPSRLGKPEEYAMLAASIIANPMLNGETIRLDGAIRMAPR
jgi:NAD(P)-dependent dehydrogenase (short-subunit alcohol dehydrogenase family)